MKTYSGLVPLLSFLAALILSPAGVAQILPGSLEFSADGSFTNGSPDSSDSILITDNDLTDGFGPGFDPADAPAGLESSGPAGAAAFQWGEAASHSDYPHRSSLWFQPLSIGTALPEQSFELARLHYRNGTILTGSGANAVDIAMTLLFSQPLGIDPVSVVFGVDLINTRNTSDPIASADIVSLRDLSKPIDFTDSAGNRYFLELTFQIDQDTIDGTLSTREQFRVFEGGTGSATLLGRFTTAPVVPEPSTALLGALGMLALLRRKR